MDIESLPLRFRSPRKAVGIELSRGHRSDPLRGKRHPRAAKQSPNQNADPSNAVFSSLGAMASNTSNILSHCRGFWLPGNGNLGKKLSIRQQFDSKETSGEQALSRNRGSSAKNAGMQRTQNPKVIPLCLRHFGSIPMHQSGDNREHVRRCALRGHAGRREHRA